MPTSSFCDKSVELTRPYRGLGPWLTIKLHGIKAFEAALDEKLDLAQRLFVRRAGRRRGGGRGLSD